MVVAAHPLAAQAGADILKRGGTAIDAMVVVQMVLNLVEPQSSGIGGGAFLLFHDAQSNSLISLDGREVAPVAADESMFLNLDGEPKRWFEMVPGGLSVGVPGTLALMDDAHALWKTALGNIVRVRDKALEEWIFCLSEACRISQRVWRPTIAAICRCG